MNKGDRTRIVEDLLKKYPWLRDLQRLIDEKFVGQCPGVGHSWAGCKGGRPKLELTSRSDPSETLCVCDDCFEGLKKYVWHP
jgi:hypothetical protein